MAVTNSIGKSLNPLPSSRTGGLIPAANVIVSVASWADAIAPRRTPVTTRCKTGKAVDAVKIEWGQSYHTDVNGTVGTGGVTNVATTLPLAAGQGALMQKWMVLEIIDYVAGTSRLDYATREEVIVDTEPTGADSVVVKRGNGSGTGVAHAAGAYWGVCGIAMPYNRDFTLSPFTRGDRIHNFPQRFYGMVAADIAARNTSSYETAGDQFLKDFKTETLRQKYFLERAVVSGSRLEGDQASGDAALPYKMGGIDYFITNHSGRVNNLGGRTLSAYDLEDILRDMYKEVDDGGAKTFLMGPDTASIFDTLLNPVRQATQQDTTINTVVDTIKFRWGNVEIMPTQHLPEGRILLVDFDNINIHPFKGCAWSTKTLATDGPYDKMAIWGDYTLSVEEVTRMGLIHNFNTDLNAYPRRQYI